MFGLPRTGTTVIQTELVNCFDVPNLIESYGGNQKQDVYQWTRDWTHGVIKLLTTNIIAYRGNGSDINIVELLKQGFDGLVVTQRANIVDAIISLYYAEVVAKKYHYTITDTVDRIPFEFDLKEDRFFNEIPVYFETMTLLKDAGIQYSVFDYDLWCGGQSQTVLGQNVVPGEHTASEFIHPGIDYSSLCQNYQEVQDAAKKLINELTIC